ncbi:MAG: hypothetical protein ABSG68_05560 [Thermoguttaceae bacterium]|jgi:hypothetical protein
MDSFPVIHQNLTLLTPADQKVLPVPIADWKRIQERIASTQDPTARLEASGWAAIGASLSFLALAVTLPFSVEWSKVIEHAEYVNWPAVNTEGGSIVLTIAFLGFGVLALYWAGVKQKLPARMGEWLVEDMRDFESRHSPPRQ